MTRSGTALSAVALAVVVMLPDLAHGHWAYPSAMTKPEILAKIIGNTLTGLTSSGSTFAEYYSADGVVHGSDSKTGRYSAKWTVRDDDLMCWAYAPDFAVGGCVLLVLQGDSVRFQLIDGSTEPSAKLLPGNPQGL